MHDLRKPAQEWQDRNPLVVWRNAQGLARPQAADKFGMTDRRLWELEVGFDPLDLEWSAITPRTGITREHWATWARSKPRLGVDA